MKIGNQDKRVSCIVTIPDVTTLTVNIDPSESGLACRDKVTESLWLPEILYFGLRYRTRSGQYCWLNLRNKFAGQVPCSRDGCFRLELRVKYWICPEYLLVPSTRMLFYLQMKDELRTGKLRCDTLEQRKRLVAIMARAEQSDKCTFVTIWKDLIKEPMLNDGIKTDIEMFYRELEAEEVSCEAATQRALTLVSELRDYGVELHVASDGGDFRKVGVGPTGVTLHCSGGARLLSFSYEALIRIETDEGKTTIFTFLNDDGSSTAFPVQMTSATTADRLCRAVTEMRSFFTVREISADVLNLCSRSLLGTVISVFKQDSTLGQQYVCDVRYSMLEAYDETRRLLYKHGVLDLMATSATAATTYEQDSQDANLCGICYERLPSASLKLCGHVICFECGHKVSVCPWCRATVDNVLFENLE